LLTEKQNFKRRGMKENREKRKENREERRKEREVKGIFFIL
jgi:hypothetical protein